MTNYDEIDFSPIQALTEGEVITQSPVRDIRLPSGKVLALLGASGARVMSRLVAFLLLCVGVQIITSGLESLISSYLKAIA